MHTLSEIYIYPIKSLGGIRLATAQVEERGLQYDRRWMLTDPACQFLTQRTFAEMALLRLALLSDGLQVTHATKPFSPLFVPFVVPEGPRVRVVVWEDTCQALSVSREADEWFSTVLEKPCRLVYLPDDSPRRVDEKYVPEPFNTGFSDGYPLLIVGQAALDYLNGQLMRNGRSEPLPINRFRPNLVFTGGAPHEEDAWRELRVGSAEFRGVKPCGRCVVTTINQQTAEKGPEPLQTLVTYRKQGNKILFGQNLVVLSGGTVRQGDAVEVWARAD